MLARATMSQLSSFSSGFTLHQENPRRGFPTRAFAGAELHEWRLFRQMARCLETLRQRSGRTASSLGPADSTSTTAIHPEASHFRRWATLPSSLCREITKSQFTIKRTFYNASLKTASGVNRISRDNYISCASCHADGGQDGRVWDFT